jgi:hypothetical protein
VCVCVSVCVFVNVTYESLRRRYGTAADRCPFKIPLPGPDGVQRRKTYSHYSDAAEALQLDCAASLARGVRGRVRFYVSSDTPEEVTDAVAERLGWRNVLDKGGHSQRAALG